MKEKIRGIVVILLIGVIWAGAGLGLGLLTGIVTFDPENAELEKAAEEISEVCAIYYSKLINTADTDNTEKDKAERIEYAGTKTIGDALSDAGLLEKYKGILNRLCVDYGGNIFSENYAKLHPDRVRSEIVLSENTTLGTIYSELSIN